MPPIPALPRLLDLLRAPVVETPPAPPVRVARRMLAALVAFVVYGCLYPFAFSARPKPFLVWPQTPMAGDVVANVIIYALLGFVAFGALLPRRGGALRVLAVAALGLALSVAIEVAQAFDAGRHSSALDVVANLFGAVAGAIAAAAFRTAGFRREFDPGTNIGGALLLFALWFACRLSPFVAAIDMQQFARALAPLGSNWQPRPAVVLSLAVLWLAVFRLIAVLAPRRRTVPAGLVVALALALLRITVRGQTISPQEIYAVGIAAAAYPLGLHRAWMLSLGVALAIVLDALAPFTWTGTARPMNLVPFRAFIHGSIEGALQRLLFKCFVYGVFAWLLLQARLRPAIVILGGALAILALEFAQTRIPGRHADVTDPLIYLALALAIRRLDRLDLRHPAARNALGVGGPLALQSVPRQGGS